MCFVYQKYIYICSGIGIKTEVLWIIQPKIENDYGNR
jgi:hypothetical protein